MLRSARDEVVLFLRTLRDYLRTPSEFARKWVSGESRPMNPFAFVGVCLLVQAPMWFLLGRRLQPMIEKAESMMQKETGHHYDMAQWMSWAQEPPVHYAMLLLIGLALHPFLRLCGAKRGFAATMGVACYHTGLTTILNWINFPYQYFYSYPRMLQELLQLLDRSGRVHAVRSLGDRVLPVRDEQRPRSATRSRVALAMVLGFTVFGVVLGGVGIFLALHYLKPAMEMMRTRSLPPQLSMQLPAQDRERADLAQHGDRLRKGERLREHAAIDAVAEARRAAGKGEAAVGDDASSAW